MVRPARSGWPLMVFRPVSTILTLPGGRAGAGAEAEVVLAPEALLVEVEVEDDRPDGGTAEVDVEDEEGDEEGDGVVVVGSRTAAVESSTSTPDTIAKLPGSGLVPVGEPSMV